MAADPLKKLFSPLVTDFMDFREERKADSFVKGAKDLAYWGSAAIYTLGLLTGQPPALGVAFFSLFGVLVAKAGKDSFRNLAAGFYFPCALVSLIVGECALAGKYAVSCVRQKLLSKLDPSQKAATISQAQGQGSSPLANQQNLSPQFGAMLKPEGTPNPQPQQQTGTKPPVQKN